jgi:hypothetical protein
MRQRTSPIPKAAMDTGDAVYCTLRRKKGFDSTSLCYSRDHDTEDSPVETSSFDDEETNDDGDDEISPYERA